MTGKQTRWSRVKSKSSPPWRSETKKRDYWMEQILSRRNRRRRGKWVRNGERKLSDSCGFIYRLASPLSGATEPKDREGWRGVRGGGSQHLVISQSAAVRPNNVGAIRGNCALMAPSSLFFSNWLARHLCTLTHLHTHGASNKKRSF